MAAGSDAPANGDAPPAAPIAAISLPKGGGAIHGIGEKFAANPVTGTGSVTVPIPTSPARSGFGPQLALAYDSGSGNGPFGFGWSLSLPSITRKTDKGLPQYRDAEESDVFVLSGAEDLVPVLLPDGSRFSDSVSAPNFVIHRYRPRVEGLFARIERWTNSTTGEIHWRSISRDNITTRYGLDNASRLFDPDDPTPQSPTRIFRWLVSESYDDKGNAIIYEYAAENDSNVDLTLANERNRVRSVCRYLKRIKYGNRVSRLVQPDLSKAEWLFEVVFDFDEGHYAELAPDPAKPADQQHDFVLACANDPVGSTWSCRPDPFSSHRSCFEMRMYRRCHRVLMFHHFPDLITGENGYDGLVRSTAFDYGDMDFTLAVAIDDELSHQGSTRFASFIRSVTQSGYVLQRDTPSVMRNGVSFATYLEKFLPPVEFEYSKAAIQDAVLEADAATLENLPMGLDGSTYRWIDLDGEGVSGILLEDRDAWFYKSNLGSGTFGPLRLLPAMPSLATGEVRNHEFLDLDGGGQVDVVNLSGPMPGFFERTVDDNWESFRSFPELPNVAWDDPNLRFIDLSGDGHADLLVTEENVFTWCQSLAEDGFGPAMRVCQPSDEERGPQLLFADGTQSIYLADMCGDGLTSLVRIRNSETCYWPSDGYGRFGAKVTLDNSPLFDNPDQFDQRRIRLGDIDGSGTNDIIYLARDGVRLYFNQSGNRLSDARQLSVFPQVDNLSAVTAADLLGNGTACLVWSSSLPADARRPLRYVDLMGGVKPNLLIKSMNNLGAETVVSYAPSTRFYLADKSTGRPWITRLPFPVHVIDWVETLDRITGNRFVARYEYHHGYFDGVEREFRGFGLVEQWDTEEFGALNADGTLSSGTNIDAASHVPPVRTKSWFHTGVYMGRQHVSDFFAEREYYREPGLSDVAAGALLLDDTVIPDGLAIDDERELCRALKGSMLRQEVYALDHGGRAEHPYTVTEQNYTVQMMQGRGPNQHGVFFVHPREALSYHYERIPADPRVAHSLTLDVDDFGGVRKSAAVAYARRAPNADLSVDDQQTQARMLITCTENDFTNSIDASDDYRGPLPSASRTSEITGLEVAASASRLTFDQLLAAVTGATAIEYEASPDGTLQKRTIEASRSYYQSDDLSASLSLGQMQAMALQFESYKIAFTPGLVSQVYAGRVTSGMIEEGGYAHTEGESSWWIPSGRIFYSPDPADLAANELLYARSHFFLARRYRDPFFSPVVQTNGSGCATGKKCLEIGAINLRGVVKSDAGFIAVVTNNLNKAYFLRENDPVFNGYVVKITGDSVVFQETIQDKLGKPFTREIVKRIFTPAV